LILLARTQNVAQNRANVSKFGPSSEPEYGIQNSGPTERVHRGKPSLEESINHIFDASHTGSASRFS
jgi:hypothetical protein